MTSSHRAAERFPRLGTAMFGKLKPKRRLDSPEMEPQNTPARTPRPRTTREAGHLLLRSNSRKMPPNRRASIQLMGMDGLARPEDPSPAPMITCWILALVL